MKANAASRCSEFLPIEKEVFDLAASTSAEHLLHAFKCMVTWFRLINELRAE